VIFGTLAPLAAPLPPEWSRRVPPWPQAGALAILETRLLADPGTRDTVAERSLKSDA
jgi:hypothetical protein